MSVEAIEGMNIFLPSAASSLDSTAGAWCLCIYPPRPLEALLTKKFPPASRINVTVAWWNVRGGSAAAQKGDRCRGRRMIAVEIKHFTNKQYYRNSAKKSGFSAHRRAGHLYFYRVYNLTCKSCIIKDEVSPWKNDLKYSSQSFSLLI